MSLPSILSLFRNESGKFNNTGAWLLDSMIYQMTLKLQCTLKLHFLCKTL